MGLFDTSDETREKLSALGFSNKPSVPRPVDAPGPTAPGVKYLGAHGYENVQRPAEMPAPPPAPPEAGEAERELGRRRATDIALENGLTPEQAQAQVSAMFAGQPHLASGGGYTAAQAKMPGQFAEGRTAFEDATNAVLRAEKAYSEGKAPLEVEQGERLKEQAAGEKARMGRLVKTGGQLEELNKQTAADVAGFKVDPNRLFGQGGQRAMGTFTLGIQNIMSNIGEAMQGRPATNAILSFVRDRVAQDVALQEGDYQRMLQGHQVQRNGLMDAIEQVGNERQGAEALARQQALVYANQLDQLSARVGLTDAKAAYPLKIAASKMYMDLAAHEQQREQFNVGQTNEARRTGAASAAHASAVNAQILNERDRAKASALASFSSVSQEARPVIRDVLKLAAEKNLGSQFDLLTKAREAIRVDPTIGEAMSGFTRDIVKQLRGNKESGAFDAAVARYAAQSGLTPSQRSALDLMREFGAVKMVGRGGKSLTASEQFLYDPFLNVTGKADLGRILQQQEEGIQQEKQQLFHSAGFSPESADARYLSARLTDMVPSDYKRQAPPTLESQASEMVKK